MTQPRTKTPPVDRPYEYATLTLDEMGPLGDTIAQFEGEPINVFGGIVGEEVVARIVRYRRRRKHYVSAMVTEVVTPSPHRVVPPCPYFGPCTGCQWQHIDYERQLEMKREIVQGEIAAYESLAGVDVFSPRPGPKEFGYRNHARFNIRDQGTLGFVNRITRRFVRIDRCMLMDDGVNDVLSDLQGNVAETTQLSIRYGVNTDDFLVQPTLQDPDIPVASGQKHYREELMGRPFRVASPSFFQVNTAQTEEMVEMVRERLRLSGDEVLVDAYSGVGTFAVLLAPHVGRVVAIEESDAAMKDAAVNTLGIDNLEYRLGKTEEVLAELEGDVDALVLDPPRAGCHPDTLASVVRLRPRRTAYVSCDPVTLARDLDVLAQAGFGVESVEPVDMFPQTHHIECIATIGQTSTV